MIQLNSVNSEFLRLIETSLFLAVLDQNLVNDINYVSLKENPVFEGEVKYPKQFFFEYLTPRVNFLFFFCKNSLCWKISFFIPGQIIDLFQKCEQITSFCLFD